MKILPFVAAVATMILIAGCDRAHDEAPSGPKAEQTVAPAQASPQPATAERQFIRTSDIKFRVKDVAQATYQIEELTRNMRGFVTYTHLESSMDEKSVKAISTDSALEISHYMVVNNMTLRVPNASLDSTLKAIASLVDYLDYRTIKADDVALQIKANRMAQVRAQGNNERLQHAIESRGKKLGETAEAENTVTDQQKEADDAELANLSLKDQVAYSTISLSLYQRAVTQRRIVANEDHADDYRAGLGLRLLESLKTGWHMIEDLAVFFTRLWVLLLLALLGFLLYRKYKPRKPALN